VPKVVWSAAAAWEARRAVTMYALWEAADQPFASRLPFRRRPTTPDDDDDHDDDAGDADSLGTPVAFMDATEAARWRRPRTLFELWASEGTPWATAKDARLAAGGGGTRSSRGSSDTKAAAASDSGAAVPSTLK
jgi:hypothetical protein